MEALKHFSSFFMFAVILPAITNQSPTLNSTLIRGQYTCPGHQVNFTCVLSGGADFVTWTSNQYIGKGDQLEFSTNNEEGSTSTSPNNPSTKATLVAVSGGRITESLLQLTTSAGFPTATVGCSGDNLQPIVINFSLLEIPDTPRNVTAVQQTSLPDSDCAIYLQWQPPNNTEQTEITHYTVTLEYKQGVPSTPPATSLHTSFNLVVKSCARDAVIRVSAVDSCSREGPSSNGTLAELLASNVTTSSSTSSQSPAVSPGGLATSDVNKSRSSPTVIVGAVLGIILTLAVLIAVALAIFIWVRIRGNTNGNRQATHKKLDGVEGHNTPHSEGTVLDQVQGVNRLANHIDGNKVNDSEDASGKGELYKNGTTDSSEDEYDSAQYQKTAVPVVKMREKKNRASDRGSKILSLRGSKLQDVTMESLLPPEEPVSGSPKSPKRRTPSPIPESIRSNSISSRSSYQPLPNKDSHNN